MKIQVILRRIFFLPLLLTVCVLGAAMDATGHVQIADRADAWRLEIWRLQETALPSEWLADALGLTVCALVFVFLLMF